MEIGKIDGATRVCGEAQGYLPLPLRDSMVYENALGRDVPCMESAWTPSPDEVQSLIDGQSIIVRILGASPPPMSIHVGDDVNNMFVPLAGAGEYEMCMDKLYAAVESFVNAPKGASIQPYLTKLIVELSRSKEMKLGKNVRT